MKTYAFDVVLRDVSEITDEQTDALFAEGCDDGTPVSRDDVAWVHFDREAPSLEVAIHSAIAQVQSAGLAVVKVEMDVSAAACPEASVSRQPASSRRAASLADCAATLSHSFAATADASCCSSVVARPATCP